MGARLTSGADQAKDFRVTARHEFHSQCARDANSRLLNEAIWHNRKELACFGAEKLDKADKHSLSRERQFFQTNRVMDVLLLNDIGRHTQSQHTEVPNAAVHRLKTVS